MGGVRWSVGTATEIEDAHEKDRRGNNKALP